jgi:glycogen debranching enzyme
MDDSPAWDPVLARVVPDPELLYRVGRRDVEVVRPRYRPTDEDYGRYLALAERYRDGGYTDDGLRDTFPFLVECPAFNAIRAAAEHALAALAPLAGADPGPHRAQARAITDALVDRLYDPGTGMFHARDLGTGRLTPARCLAGLVPLMLPDLPGEVADSLVAQAGSARFGIPLPSYDRTAPDFDPLRYWRGPVWVNMNWLLWSGLRRHGPAGLAAELRASLLDLVARSGFAEYFDPRTGAGLGSPEFSWTAALVLDLLAVRPPSPA